MTSETTAYLAEAQAPSVIPIAEAQQGALDFITMTGRLDQQIALWMRLLSAAEFVESEIEIRAHFEEHMQTLRALQRELRNAERELRQGGAALRQFAGVAARLQATVDALPPPAAEESAPATEEPVP